MASTIRKAAGLCLVVAATFLTFQVLSSRFISDVPTALIRKDSFLQNQESNMASKGNDEKVIVVLGAPTTSDGKPGPDLKDRLDLCLSLLATDDYSSSVVVVSGGSPRTYGSAGTHSEGKIMASYLLERGVETNRILVEDQALHTFHNALYSKTLLRKHNLLGSGDPMELVVLTSDWHLERSLWCFRAVFCDLPNLTLVSQVVLSDRNSSDVVARITAEQKIEREWVQRCIQEEKDHPDMPDQAANCF